MDTTQVLYEEGLYRGTVNFLFFVLSAGMKEEWKEGISSSISDPSNERLEEGVKRLRLVFLD